MIKMSSLFFLEKMMLEKSVCQITYRSGEEGIKETGWLCSDDGWVITAGHAFVKEGEIYSGNTGAVTDSVRVKFPGLNEIPGQLLYAEKNNQEGIDFAVLSLMQPPAGIRPLHVILDSRNQAGDVQIVGAGSIFRGYFSSSTGYVESELVDIESGIVSFLHISAENAVQTGYSGAPVFSLQANAVIGMQVMASQSGQYPEIHTPVAEQRTINAMTIQKMVDRYPELEKHLIVLKRPFSGFDILTAIQEQQREGTSHSRGVNDKTIDETILPMAIEQHFEDKRDLGEPILDAIYKADDRNCFVLGEEGGSGKTTALLKLFSSLLATGMKIPVYIELRNLPTQTAQYNVYDEPGRLIAEYLVSEWYDILREKGSVFVNREDMREQILKEFTDPSYQKTKYLLLLDGLNEVSLTRRPEVCEEILFWAKNPHIQVIVTSRYKEDMLVEENMEKLNFSSFEDFFTEDRQLKNDSNSEKEFLLLVIQKLKPQVVSDYLRNYHIREKIIEETMNNKELLDILRTPMYLAIFTRLYNIRNQMHKRDSGNKLRDICTRGELLYEFFGEKTAQITGKVAIQKDKLERKDTKENRKKIFIFEKIIPYIAFQMAIERNYSMQEKDLVKLLDGLIAEEDSSMKRRAVIIREYKTIYELYYDRSNLKMNSFVDTRFSPSETVIRFIVEELHIMRKTYISSDWSMHPAGGKESVVIRYEFLHENLRDYFAARQLQEDVRCSVPFNLSESISLAQRDIPRTVLEFFGDICHEHESRPVCDSEKKRWEIRKDSFIKNILGPLRGRHDEDAKIMVSNIIAVMRYSRKNDLSGLDLSDLDFSETWLGGIRFSRAYGNTYLSATFDGATIRASNLLRNGHDADVTCVKRDMCDLNIVYSGDASGRVMRWNCVEKTGETICCLNEYIRDMLILAENEDTLYIASEHVIYQLGLSDLKVNTLYKTKAFLQNIKSSESGISFKTDTNPSVWIRLVIDDKGEVCEVIGDEYSMPFWPASPSCENNAGTCLITGGTSKTHRVQVFHRKENEEWNMIPVQTVAFPYGNRMKCLKISADETRILICIQKCLYEYSLLDGMLDTELFHLYSDSEIDFASYCYNKEGEFDGILYSCGAEIVFLDKNYKRSRRLESGNGICYYASPFLVDHRYRFSRQGGMQRGVQEKYLLYLHEEIQEFDADTNICDRIYDIHQRSRLGFYMKDHKVRLFFLNLRNMDIESSQLEDTSSEDIQFIDYSEMRDFVGFRIQRLGQQIIVYDRYTGEQDSFKIYRGLFIQGCSMKGLKGDMQRPENQEILRRYGAILEEE